MDQTIPLNAVNPSASTLNLQVVQRRATDLVPYVKNARTHSEAQIEILCRSLKEFGWTSPILIDGQNGVIAGHGRLKAAQKLGMAEVPCIVLDHMTDAQRRAYVLADNQTALLAGWDDELLALELGDLNEMGFDIPAIGFSSKELDELLGENGDVPGLPDDPTEPRAATVTSDEFTMSVRGRRTDQQAILAALQEALKPFGNVTIELGIMAIETAKAPEPPPVTDSKPRRRGRPPKAVAAE